MTSVAPARPAPPYRLPSLDAFRGATIALMILVNNAGDWGKTYPPLLHAPWHGWTPTDLVFPFFLFIVGVAIPFALPADPMPGVHRKILRRTLLLFGLGLFLIWFPIYTVNWERFRIPGVLQRIAIVYLVAALAHLHLRPRGRAVLSFSLLAGYWAAMRFIPVPEHGAGDLSPEGNLAFWLDSQILGSHIWRYSPGPGDPEGILSTAPAIVSALLGIFAGERLRAARHPGRERWRLALAGAGFTAAGLLLHLAFPINKNLWSPSYVVFTTGAALVLLALGSALIDSRPEPPRWSWPLVIFGRNSILAYAGSSLLARLLGVIKVGDGAGGTQSLQRFLYGRFVDPVFPDYVASLVWALATVLLWLAILAALHRRRIFLRL